MVAAVGVDWTSIAESWNQWSTLPGLVKAGAETASPWTYQEVAREPG